MTVETRQEFDDRRSAEEKTLAERAQDRVQSIPHDQLSKLHADEALAGLAIPAVRDSALDVTVVAGSVVLTSETGERIRLTPEAACLTSDRLLARARQAAAENLAPLSTQ